MRKTVTINGTPIALASIIRFAQPDNGPLGRFYPRQWLDPVVYKMTRDSLRAEYAKERARKHGRYSYFGDAVEVSSGGYLWLYHLDTNGNLRSDAFTWKRGVENCQKEGLS